MTTKNTKEGKHPLFGYINGDLESFEPATFINKCRDRQMSLHTNRLINDSDSIKECITITCDIIGDNVWVDAEHDTWVRDTDYDPDDGRNYQGRYEQERVLDVDCGKGDEGFKKAIEVLEKFKNEQMGLREDLNKYDINNEGASIEELHSAMFDVLSDLSKENDAESKKLLARGKRIYNKYALSPFQESLEDDGTSKVKKVDDFIDSCYEMRQDSISKDGEFGIGNLVFKEMRAKGYLDKLRDIKKDLSSKELSLESVNKVNEEKDTCRYAYDGPVFQFGKHIATVHLETSAVSLKQAINNLKYQACNVIGCDRRRGDAVDIDEDIIEEISCGKEMSHPICPKCGLVNLNDAGECPLCDLGDASILDD